MKLIDQWNSIKALIEEKQQAFIDQQEGLPTVFYQVQYNGILKEYPVLKVEYLNGEQLPYYSGKKPTREDIRNIQGMYYNLVLDKKYLRLMYDQYNSYRIEHIENDERMFFDKAAAEKLSKEITDRIVDEDRLLAGGEHDRCQRCRKVVPKSQIVISTIIGRDRKAVYNSCKNRYENKAVVTQTDMRFCGGECAAHEQMSREG